MILDLLRHGASAPAGPDGDRERALTREGARDILRLADRLAADSPRPDRVFASPLLRARETARIVVDRLALSVECEELPELEPDRHPSDVLDALRARGATTGHVLLVGHQPLLGRLAGALAGGDRGLATGELARIACDVLSLGGGGLVVATFRP